jgi:hypothetical protein
VKVPEAGKGLVIRNCKTTWFDDKLCIAVDRVRSFVLLRTNSFWIHCGKSDTCLRILQFGKVSAYPDGVASTPNVPTSVNTSRDVLGKYASRSRHRGPVSGSQKKPQDGDATVDAAVGDGVSSTHTDASAAPPLSGPATDTMSS